MKHYTIDGIKYIFNNEELKSAINKHKYKDNIKKSAQDIQEELANEIHYSPAAIHSWVSGTYSPIDIELLKKIANFFNMSHMDFLKRKGDNTMNKNLNTNESYNTLQIESIKKIYDTIIEFLLEFNNTMGFTGDLWYKYMDQGYNKMQIKNEIYDYIDTKINNIHLVILQEYFYLKNTEIYNKIEDYFYNDLIDTYNEKIDITYRTNADYEDVGISTREDYNKAMDKLNDIVKNIF